MKTLPLVAAIALPLSAFAGATPPPVVTTPVDDSSVFDAAQRPITNPTLFDLPLARTQLHAIYMYHRFPDSLDTQLGEIPAGGQANIFALQFELALTDTLSFTATKDGYADVDFDSNSPMSDGDGFANLAGGLKWNFYKNEETGVAAAFTGVVEFPVGDKDIFQGEGDGAAILSFSGMKIGEKYQVASVLGAKLPFDNDAESIVGYASGHVSYKVTSWFQPLIEANWFYVIDEGDGGSRYNNQVGGAVPAVVNFEGGDLFNLGAANASENRNFFTIALGARFPITENFALGAAYEMPLTDDGASLMKDRITVDMVYTF